MDPVTAGAMDLSGGTQPVPIASMDELIASVGATRRKEEDDRLALQQFISIDRVKLREKLFEWAGLGFPNIFCALSVSISTPAPCSDGVTRNMYQYIEWVTNKTIPDMITNIQSQMDKIEVSYSIGGESFNLHITKIN